MKRLLVALAALLLVLASAPIAALASDDDDAAGTSSSGPSGDADDADDAGDTSDDDDGRDDSDDSGDTPDDSDDDDDDDNDADDDDDVADDDDDDDDGHHQRRHRRRHRNRGGDGDGATPPAGGGGGGGPTGPAPATGAVEIQDRSFAPASVRVAVGGTVTWSNVSREHTVTADDGSFDSGVIDAGVSFDHTFPAAGTFDYKCLIHPEMVGTVTVGDAAQGAGGGGGGTGAAASGSSASVGSSSTSSAASSAGAAGRSGLPAIGAGAVPAPLTAAAVESADVDVLDFEFAPSNVTVNPGATVRWTLRGEAPHTVTSDSFDSGMLKPGDVYEQTFNDTGEFAYRCDFHPEMTGTVTVAAIDAAPPTTDDGGGAAGGDTGGGDAGAGAVGDDAQAAVSSGSGSLLADSGFRGVPAFAFALGVILLGWAALVTGRRRSVRSRATV